MHDDEALRAELQQTWHREIPLAAAMQLEVEHAGGATLTVRAPLEPNRNLHGTAFAGALFSVAVLTGWGATWLALKRRGLGGLIVVADSTIRYRKAVTGELLCRCTVDDAAVAAFAEELEAAGKARLVLECRIESRGAPAVAFTGTYVVHRDH